MSVHGFFHPRLPVLANIIMIELENQIVSKLVSDNTIKFYIRYFDDTLVLFKRPDVKKVMSQQNSFHKNLNFTVDSFLDQNIHFLDFLIDKNLTGLYYKDTHTKQYTSFPVSLLGILKLLGSKHYILELTKFAAILNYFRNKLKELITICLGTIFLREFSTGLRKTSTVLNYPTNL